MSYKNLTENTIQSEQIFQGTFIKVYRDKVQLPDSNIAIREYVKHSGAAAILALDSNNNLIMEYQYRHPVNQTILEIPAGKLDSGEDELSCAKRELFEETGYSSKQWTFLGECLPCVGYSNERIIYFLAEEIEAGTPQLDPGEFLEIAIMPLEKALHLAKTGKIKDSKTLAGLMLLEGHLAKCLA